MTDEQICNVSCGIEKPACFGECAERCPDMVKVAKAAEQETLRRVGKWLHKNIDCPKCEWDTFCEILNFKNRAMRGETPEGWEE